MRNHPDFQTDSADGVLVISFCDPNPLESILDENSLQDLADCLKRHPNQDVVVDFGFVHWAPTIALAGLIKSKQDFVNDHRMVLCGVSDTAHVACRFLNLDRTFEIFDTRSQAVNAIKSEQLSGTAQAESVGAAST